MEFLTDYWLYLLGGGAFLIGLVLRTGGSGTTGDSGGGRWWDGCDGDGDGGD